MGQFRPCSYLDSCPLFTALFLQSQHQTSDSAITGKRKANVTGNSSINQCLRILLPEKNSSSCGNCDFCKFYRIMGTDVASLRFNHTTRIVTQVTDMTQSQKKKSLLMRSHFIRQFPTACWTQCSVHKLSDEAPCSLLAVLQGIAMSTDGSSLQRQEWRLHALGKCPSALTCCFISCTIFNWTEASGRDKNEIWPWRCCT
jgi:hypothetical protein